MRRLFGFYGLSIVGMIVLLIILAGQDVMTNQRVAAVPLSYSASLHSESEWLKISRDTVHVLGMVAAPESESWALMTRGSYLTLGGGGGTTENRDLPIFVYQAFGDMPVFNMFGGVGAGYQDIGGVALIFDGQSGMFLSWAAYPKEHMARGLSVLDLSFIPADSGPLPQQYPLPTHAAGVPGN